MSEEERAGFQIILGDLDKHLGTLGDHLSTTFRWLMATLFAANGGAIIALLGSTGEGISSRRVALSLFAAGLLFSLLTGILSAIWSYRGLMGLSMIRAKVVVALITSTSDASIVHDLNAQKPTWTNWFPSYACVASFVCLLLGVVTLASAA